MEFSFPFPFPKIGLEFSTLIPVPEKWEWNLPFPVPVPEVQKSFPLMADTIASKITNHMHNGWIGITVENHSSLSKVAVRMTALESQYESSLQLFLVNTNLSNSFNFE